MDASVLTLRSFYDAAFLPIFLAGADPRTIDAYCGSIGAWEKHTADPKLTSITTVTLAHFKNTIAATTSRVTKRTTSPATVNKHLRHVGAILSKAGPPGSRNRDALGLLERVPWVKPFKLKRRRPHAVGQDTLAKIYEACQHAIHPNDLDVDACTWWRALIVCAYNCGMRREALLALRKADVDLAAGVICTQAEDDKRDTERSKPINAELKKHLRSVITNDELVFRFRASESTFYRQWHELQTLAGIDRKQHHKLHDLKRTCGTELGRTENAHTIALMLDHSSVQMGSAYVDPTEQLRAAAERMRQPWQQQLLFS